MNQVVAAVREVLEATPTGGYQWYRPRLTNEECEIIGTIPGLPSVILDLWHTSFHADEIKAWRKFYRGER